MPRGASEGQLAPTELASGEYEATSEKRLREWTAAPYFLLPSYGLSSIDIVGDTASGWAVGDHGAILRLSGEETAKSTPEPEPPQLGTRRASELPDSPPYSDKRPAPSGDVGTVPGLSGRPVETLEEPRLFAGGAPAGGGPGIFTEGGTFARDVAMSRDGSEGWAVGPKATLYHYDGSAWGLCDYFGLKGQLPPDPACAGVSGVRLFADRQGVLQAVELRAIARVPLENDADPTNDDEFEAVAVGSSWFPQDAKRDEETGNPIAEPVVLRYSQGHWRFEDSGARAEVTNESVEAGEGIQESNSGLTDVAFTAPDDGWMLARPPGGGSAGLFHYDGERWADCDVDAGACFDPGKRLSAQPRLTVANAPGSGAGEVGLEAAGDRVYLFGTRQPLIEVANGFGGSPQNCPAIIYHERGEPSWHGSLDGSDGSLDPGFDPDLTVPDKSRQCDIEQEMRIDSLAIGQRADGAYEGWAIGQLLRSSSRSSVAIPSELRVLQLGTEGAWQRFHADDALSDYFVPAEHAESSSQLMLPTADGGLGAFVVEQGRLLRFDPAQERWEVTDSDDDLRSGSLDNLTSDGQSGFWATRVREVQHFLHYTDLAPKPVFEEVPNPLGSSGYITAATAGPDGSFWLTTNSNALYHYDRLIGWDRVHVQGWDSGRIVTRASHALAIAINESGMGVVVGEQGRITEIEGETVRLDTAAGTVCELAAIQAPCGTGRDLKAAAVAPDGSAMVGGRGLALLWRPAGGDFRAIARPDAAAQTTITAISMPAADRAWLTTDTGFLFAGRLTGPGQWSWRLESVNERGDVLTLDALGGQSALRAVAIDEGGHGYAVGDVGVILERTGDSEHPWRRLDTPYLDSFTSVALASGAGKGALVGGERGIVLSLSGEQVELARAAEACCGGGEIGTDQLTYMRPVVGLALLPGPQEGQAEAWAAVQGSSRGDSTLLHYASDPEEPLLQPQGRAEALPDGPPTRTGEFSLAAFGGTRCLSPRPRCEEMAATNEDYEIYTQRTIDEIAERSGEPGGPELAIFSGDLADTMGTPGPGRNAQAAPLQTTTGVSGPNAPGTLKLRRWSEIVADRLADRGVPLLAAIGGGDISTPTACVLEAFCLEGQSATSAGENLAWREAMASRPAPWGREEPIEDGELRLEPVADPDLAIDPDEAGFGDLRVNDPDGEGQLSETRVQAGGARTHYAADVVRGEERIARLIFVDTSLRSLSAADPIQNPLEPRGQLAWLQETLCTEGSALDRDDSLLDCTREPGQRAIVVSNAPTYSYGPGQNQTALDAAALEQVLFEGNADLMISGRIGWNGLYYALSPLVHRPDPGGSYPDRAPEPLQGQPEPIPFIVASGAGAFSPDGSGEASDGFWHGYTIVRIDLEGGETIVEQRPIFDWLHIAGEKRVLGARERLVLNGIGREPIAASPEHVWEVRDDEISSAAITHRYDLVLADPEQPWVPCKAADPDCRTLASKFSSAKGSGLAITHSSSPWGSGLAAAAARPDPDSEADNPCEPYLCLPERVGVIDSQTGEIKAGNGKYPDTFAIAMLSVGDHVATYPLAFRKSPSFVVNPLRLPPPAPGPAPTVPNNPQAPPPPSVPKPNVPQPSLPGVPALPGIPPLAAAQPPEPQPPAPPTPPPPAEQPSPLDLTVSPTALTVATPAAVIQPPTPPVNPAPPSGARREARQRQAAVQKSGADSDADATEEGVSRASDETRAAGGDAGGGPRPVQGAGMSRRDVPGPNRNAYTRASLDPGRATFTPLDREQPSAWVRGLLYSGGMTVAALILALGMSRAGPTPRRREPQIPAPAQAQLRRRP